MKLQEYNKKRDFNKTSEPKGKAKSSGKNIFVIQKHHARALHYDFRIENEGVLVSWAIPRGPTLSFKEKRLAVLTEDHPLDYADFEGTIPEGEYGAGRVEQWDIGTYENMTHVDHKPASITEGLKDGHVHIKVHGKKLKGEEYIISKGKDKKNWIMIHKDTKKRRLEPKQKLELTNGDKEIFKGVKKREYVAYYYQIAEKILPHLEKRALSMYRFPDGPKDGFFQKEKPEYFPKWIDSVKIKRKEGKSTNHVVVTDIDSLLYLANYVCEFHVGISKKPKLDYADRMIFDLDPAKGAKHTDTIETAKLLKNFLLELDLQPYIMTTGGKGYHITTPLKPTVEVRKVKEFAGKIANVLTAHYPKFITNEMRIEKRGKKIFIDTYRNSPTHTAICPYSVRGREGGPIATPIRWKDLEKIKPKDINIKNWKEYNDKHDPWNDFSLHAESLKKIMKRLE